MEYNVLILEDNELDASLINRFLKRSEYKFNIKWVTTGQAYEKAVEHFKPDVIISDYRLKQYTGQDAIQYKNLNCEDIPIIIVSGMIGEEKAVELIKKGATDFLIKNSISSRLAQTVMRAIKESLEKEKRRKAELQLKSSEERFRMLFEQSMDGIIITDPDKKGIITANDAACQITGYTYSELRGMDLEDFIDLEEEKMARGIEDLVRKKFYRGDIYIKRKNGTLFPVDASRRIVQLKNEDRRAFYIIRDISERKLYEEQLKKEKAFTDKALNSLPGIFYVLDDNYNYIRINNNMQKELGYSWEEIKDMSPLDLFNEEDHSKISSKLREAFTNRESSTVAPLKGKDGTSRYYHITAAHFKQGKSDYLLGTAINISEQVEAQQKIHKSLKEKETLLTEIHHRVKNNLAVVSGMMQLQAFNDENEELNDKLLNCVSRIKSIALIHEHLYQSESLSHIEVDQNLRDLIDKIKDTYSFKTEITHHFDLQKIVLNVNQAVPLVLIINEIIINIYKHAFAGRAAGKISITLKKEGDTIDLTIRDNGIGLPKEFNLKNSGSLGLSLINTLTSQLEAEADIHSDKETVFRLTFDKKETTGSSNAL